MSKMALEILKVARTALGKPGMTERQLKHQLEALSPELVFSVCVCVCVCVCMCVCVQGIRVYIYIYIQGIRWPIYIYIYIYI
jgi:hypothetical protein